MLNYLLDYAKLYSDRVSRFIFFYGNPIGIGSFLASCQDSKVAFMRRSHAMDISLLIQFSRCTLLVRCNAPRGSTCMAKRVGSSCYRHNFLCKANSEFLKLMYSSTHRFQKPHTVHSVFGLKHFAETSRKSQESHISIFVSPYLTPQINSRRFCLEYDTPHEVACSSTI